jgi:hypothetical protein
VSTETDEQRALRLLTGLGQQGHGDGSLWVGQPSGSVMVTVDGSFCEEVMPLEPDDSAWLSQLWSDRGPGRGDHHG